MEYVEMIELPSTLGQRIVKAARQAALIHLRLASEQASADSEWGAKQQAHDGDAIVLAFTDEPLPCSRLTGPYRSR